MPSVRRNWKAYCSVARSDRITRQPYITEIRSSVRLGHHSGVDHAEDQSAVSNICMTKPNRWFVRISVFLLLSSFTLSCGIQGHGQSNALLAEPSQSLDNTPQATLDAVRVFYTYVTRYQPLGIPRGRAKKALWPLMSKRLGRELDSLQACDDDYYRR